MSRWTTRLRSWAAARSRTRCSSRPGSTPSRSASWWRPSTCTRWRTSPAAGCPGNAARPLPAGVGMRIDLATLGAAGGVRLAGVARRRGGGDAPGVQPGRRLPRRSCRRSRAELAAAGAERRRRDGLGRRASWSRATGWCCTEGRRADLGIGHEPAGADRRARHRDRLRRVEPGRRGRAGARRAGRAARRWSSADEDETAGFLDRHGVELVVLAGYMRILSAGVRQPVLRPDPERPPVAAAGVSRGDAPWRTRWSTAFA